MAEALRKAFSYTIAYLESFGRHYEAPAPKDDDFRVGEYRADYKMPSREELQAADPELQELYQNSKIVSVKREA